MENSKLLPQTGIPQVLLALQTSPKVCWSGTRSLPPGLQKMLCCIRSRSLPCSPGAPHISLLPFLPEQKPKLLWKYVSATWSTDKSIPNKLRWAPPPCYAVRYAKSSSRSHCVFEVPVVLLKKRGKKHGKDRPCYFLAGTELHRQDREKGRSQQAASPCRNPAKAPCKKAARCIWILPTCSFWILQIRAGTEIV